MPPPAIGFLVTLGITLVLLGAVVVTGKRAQRRRHLPLVFATLVVLALTIYYAERLGEYYDFSAAQSIHDFHVFVAKATVVAYLLPLASGIGTLRNARRRKLHGRVAFFVLGLTVLTAVTGVMMLIMAEQIS
jgi:uncharacterized membrane protein YoaT (DUF817 family)